MKKCVICKVEKPTTEFNRNRAKSDGLNTLCRKCSNAKSRQYYKDNKDKHKQATIERSRIIRRRNAAFIQSYKSGLSCKYCSESESCCLDFHHRDPDMKISIVSRMTDRSLLRIIEEIEKCDLVCSNCHRKIHAGLLPD